MAFPFPMSNITYLVTEYKKFMHVVVPVVSSTQLPYLDDSGHVRGVICTFIELRKAEQ